MSRFFFNLDHAITTLVPDDQGVVVQLGANDGVEMDEINTCSVPSTYGLG
jgi:hypothetical protein